MREGWNRRIGAGKHALWVHLLSAAIVLSSRHMGRAQEPVTAEPPSTMEVPFRSEKRADGQWKAVVSARVVGIDIDCLIDTGGESSLLPKEFLRHFPQRAEKIITDSNGQRRVYEVGPAEVVVGKTLIGKFPFVVVGDYLQLTRGKEVWDANGPSLGINILGNFRIRIDGPKGRMTLSRDDGPLEGSGWIAYTGFNGTPHQTVEAKTVAGEKLRLFLDTGYAQSRIIKRLCGPKETPLQLVVGETRVEGPAMVLEGDSDLRFSSQGKEDIIIHATLGWDILRDLVMELSPKNKQLRLSKGK